MRGLPRHAPIIVAALALGVDCACATTPASAAYPSHPLRLILGYPPGGASDAVARLLAQSVGGRLGQTIVIDNRPGAGGRTRAVNRVPACGM